MVFRWQTDDGPLIVVNFDPTSSHQSTKKRIVTVGPSLTKLSGLDPRMDADDTEEGSYYFYLMLHIDDIKAIDH